MKTKKLVLSSLFVSFGVVLPMAFHMFNMGGSVFLPMHIPVLLCGFIVGWKYGLICGIITPLLSSLFTGMPVMFPIGIGMVFELATYGLLCGLLYKNLKTNIYVSLIGAMLGGRAVSGIVNAIVMGVASKPYGLSIFLTNSFVKAIPGIIIQIVLIQLLIIALEKAGQLEKVN